MLALRAAAKKQMAYLEPQNTYSRILREELGEDGIAVMGMTQVAYAARVNFPVYKPRTCITSGYQGTLGFAFPTGLGVKVARPDAPVIAVCGDGGFMYCAGELAAAVQHGIPLVAIVFNNDAYGNVRKMQIRYYDERVIASDLVNPDFVKLGRGIWRERLPRRDRDAAAPSHALRLQKRFAHLDRSAHGRHAQLRQPLRPAARASAAKCLSPYCRRIPPFASACWN